MLVDIDLSWCLTRNGARRMYSKEYNDDKNYLENYIWN